MLASLCFVSGRNKQLYLLYHACRQPARVPTDPTPVPDAPVGAAAEPRHATAAVAADWSEQPTAAPGSTTNLEHDLIGCCLLYGFYSTLR